MIDLAVDIVKKAFGGKVDKADQPYINHLIRVMNACPNIGNSDDYCDLKIITLLHDLLEDFPTEWDEGRLRCLFSNNIVEGVIALTHKQGQSYNDYISQILENQLATIVKKYNLEDNMDMTRLKTITTDDINRLKKYHKAYKRIISYIPGIEKQN